MGAILGMLSNVGLNLISDFIGVGEDKAKKFIKEKTGIDLDKKDVLTKEEIEKLKEFQTQNKNFILKQIELFNQDRANARNMQITALKQKGWLAKNFIYIFAGTWSIFAMIYIFAITFYNVPASSQRFADTILGFLLGTIVAAIIQFFFGSSDGSKNKEELLNNVLSNKKNIR